jgi:hypothetical protein
MTRSASLARPAGISLVTLLLGAACAGRGAFVEEEGAQRGVTLWVRNNLSSPSALRVYVISEGGARDLLGTVSPAETKSLPVRQPPVGRYRFLARTDGGSEVISNIVTFHENEVLEWDLFSNVVTTRHESRERTVDTAGRF